MRRFNSERISNDLPPSTHQFANGPLDLLDIVVKYESAQFLPSLLCSPHPVTPP